MKMENLYSSHNSTCAQRVQTCAWLGCTAVSLELLMLYPLLYCAMKHGSPMNVFLLSADRYIQPNAPSPSEPKQAR